MQNQNEGVVAWASRERGDPDPGKAPQIRRRRGVSGRREEEGGRKASRTRGRLLHEEALAGGRFGFGGRRLFLDLAETEFKHFGCRMREGDQNLLSVTNWLWAICTYQRLDCSSR